jgi:uncharacterized alpha-E superfamily protein
MLSRTASDLYWMSRYLERVENLARMLDVSYSLSLMPQDGRGDGLDEIAMPLLITGTLEDVTASCMPSACCISLLWIRPIRPASTAA